ncbi:NAD/NADP transhydrogenase alpha subunit [Ammoniphilus sp. CFH 90114]|uniref:NAD/NADP transhydrogenase alpha subunit n=1 Tax=Ammoniphilus sp. CFH 90114 TaxID=2493665 RepID=UPI00100F4475|nr:NAD/NADP transhydrogenase alpha subunit [Ammoniphilus sp. CFH 90114]RXT08130.1 NAD/NADP transhydrogenase alpha subunit [Ammoniphilus sp. CFH 90114]
MKCISVYTKDFEVFSDIYERILELNLDDNEETEIDGITVGDAGEIPDDYIEKMRQKPEVAVMRIKKQGVIILQHGEVFEILIPTEEDEEAEETA